MELLGLPDLASEHGGRLDEMLAWIHVVMVVLFVGWLGFFFFLLWRFRAGKNPTANYEGTKSHASTYHEIAVVVVEAVLLIGFSVPLWAERVGDFLPTEKDYAYVQSLMVPVYEAGKFAGWIAPPPKGLNGQPIDFDYVRLMDEKSWLGG